MHGRAVSRPETLRAVPVFHDAGYTSLLISYRNDGDAPRNPIDHRFAGGFGALLHGGVDPVVAHQGGHRGRPVGWRPGRWSTGRLPLPEFCPFCTFCPALPVSRGRCWLRYICALSTGQIGRPRVAGCGGYDPGMGRLTAGEHFAGFRIIRALGAGGMGEVYLVEHPRLPRQEALKVLSAELSADPSFRQRFTREADLNMIRIGKGERFEIPEALPFGG